MTAFLFVRFIRPIALGVLAAVAAMVGAVWSNPASAGENYALLVAVGEYNPTQLNKLPYTRNDVVEFREVLLQSGFETENIVLMHDDPKGSVPARLFPESAKIRRQLALILSGRDDDDTVILAFAGHGIQFKGDDANYFCPLDVDLDKKETLVPLKEIYDAMKACGAKKKLLLVDACRNDPRSPVARSRATVDLESITRPQKLPVPETVMAYFSCAAGQQSFEWPDLKHGVFFYHVLDVWKNGGADRKELTLDELVYHSRKKTEAFVRNTLEQTQTPELHGKSAGKWVLREYKELPPPLFDAKNGKTAAEAKASQEAWAKHLKTSVEIENSLGMTLRLIPPGEYLRGSTPEEIAAVAALNPTFKREEADHEQPRHVVRLTDAFYLASTEVTLGQFLHFYHDYRESKHELDCEKGTWGGWGYDASTGKFDKNKNYRPWSWGHPNQSNQHPVVNVSWNDATAFCEWLSRKEGKKYRLPTEAEWEFACRAGTTGMFSSGDTFDALAGVANVTDQSSRRIKGLKYTDAFAAFNDGHPFTAPIGSFRANGFGLFDMHGNVWEWCADRYDVNAYKEFSSKPAVNPVGDNEEQSQRVLRGGSWSMYIRDSRSASRYRFYPAFNADNFGFRLLRTL